MKTVIYKDQAKFLFKYGLCFLICGCLFSCIQPSWALKLSSELKSAITKTLPVARIRLDGAIETKNNVLYLPLVPAKAQTNAKKEIIVKGVFPSLEAPEALLFDNGWCFLKVINIDHQQTFAPVNMMPQEIQKAIFSAKLASDLIVPDRFALPPLLKGVAGSASVPIKDTVKANVEEKDSQAHSVKKISNSGKGCILITSPATGKISLFSYPELIKIIEFPIEGTPSGVAYANGKVYIADQSKDRILKLDPNRNIFLGQINLPKGSAPKDVAALPDGKLIYVSENMLGDVAVFETDTDKLLVKTKVNSFPGRMGVTSDGTTLLILSVPDSKVSILSTQNQRFLGTIAVGSLPSGIAINNNGKTAYISNRVSNTVSVVDLVRRAVVLILKTGIGPTGIAVDSNKNRLYIANAKDNSITIFDLSNSRKVTDVKLPMDVDFPGALMLLPDNKHILVTSESTDALGLFDTTTQTFEKIVSVGHNSDQCLWVPLN